MKKGEIIFRCKVAGGAFRRMLRFSQHFGWSVAWHLFCTDIQKYFSDSKAGREKANTRHRDVIEAYLRSQGYTAGALDGKGQEDASSTAEDGKENIWVCWWQGEAGMPEMVKRCYNSIKRYANGHTVKLITFDNYRDFVEIDQRIVEKVKNGTFRLAHFADLVRLKLLSRYGGLWLDSTMLLTSPIDERFFDGFFSVKIKPIENDSVSEYRWCSFILGGGKKVSFIYSQLAKMLERYMLENEVFIDYLLIDYFLDMMYRDNRLVKELIDTMPYTNPALHELRLAFDREFNEREWNSMLSGTSIFKLTYKGLHVTHTNNGTPTFYGYILADGTS